MSPEYLYGCHWRTIEFVRDIQVRHLTTARAERITLGVSHNTSGVLTAERAAIRASQHHEGREEQAVRSSEHLRESVWDVVWESSWGEAWTMSWVLARAGMGLATVDLVGTYSYTIEHYIELVGPWTAGFVDLPIPREEVAI